MFSKKSHLSRAIVPLPPSDSTLIKRSKAHVGLRCSQNGDQVLAPQHQGVPALLDDVAWDLKGRDVCRITGQFGSVVSAAVDALTTQDGQDYDANFSWVEADPIAVKVKLAEWTDNSEMSRLKHASEKDKNRLASINGRSVGGRKQIDQFSIQHPIRA